MQIWHGAAAVCINPENKILMVKQGTPEEKKVLSIPSGGKEEGETFEKCCIREVREETGYDIEIKESLFVKETTLDGYSIVVHYFSVTVTGGEMRIQDPDELIHDIGWKSAEELIELELSYPDDRKFLHDMLMASAK